jgi:hypothetical protein
MRLTKLDLKQIIKEEIQKILQKESAMEKAIAAAQYRAAVADAVEKTDRHEKLRVGHPFRGHHSSGHHHTRIIPIDDPADAAAAVKEKGDEGYESGKFGALPSTGRPEYPRRRGNAAQLQEKIPDSLVRTIQEEYDKLLGEAEEEGEGTTIDISAATPGGMAPFGIPQDQWETVGTSAVGE